MKKLTKLVSTIGPATETEEILKDMILAGMNIARFNTKHSDPVWHNERIKRVHKVAEELNTPVGILLDLQGPEIRINLPEEKSFELKKGDKAHFTFDLKLDKENLIFIPKEVVPALSVGNTVLLADGACEFTIVETHPTYVVAQAVFGCTVGHRKTMNTPGITLEMPSLTDRDYLYLDGIQHDLIDFVGLSFVRSKRDIDILKAELHKRKIDAHIVAKIENQAALDNLDEIIEAADAVMVARGDLGVEVEYQQLIRWQKTIIDKCRIAAKPVITATEMLKSMVEKNRPTRAEVSDVAHAVYDETDAVTLSDETTVGKYPVEAVKVQATIASYNEPFVNSHELTIMGGDDSELVTFAASELLQSTMQPVDKVVLLTETGRTARLFGRLRTKTPVFAVTSNEKTLRQLGLIFGVTPFLIELPQEKLEERTSLLHKFKAAGIINSGEKILLIYGTFWKKPGLTNSLSVVTVE
jgi:pyruvate kinase